MVKNVLNTLRKKQKNNKGFSLVELIIVIAIMAVLVGVLAPQLIMYVEKSREATDIQTCDNIATALKTYYADDESTANSPVIVTLSSAGIEETSETAIVEAGLNNAKLKGTKWTENNKKITIQYDKVTKTITYTGGSKYYHSENDQFKNGSRPEN